MGIGFLDSQKGEKSKFWKLESNGPACSHHRVVGGVCALRRVGFTSQLWSWTRAGPGQTFGGHCAHLQGQEVLERVKAGGRWALWGFSHCP